jgi:hypothetical protein
VVCFCGVGVFLMIVEVCRIGIQNKESILRSMTIVCLALQYSIAIIPT